MIAEAVRQIETKLQAMYNKLAKQIFYDPTMISAAIAVVDRQSPSKFVEELKSKWLWDDKTCAAAIALAARELKSNVQSLGSSDKISKLINRFLEEETANTLEVQLPQSGHFELETMRALVQSPSSCAALRAHTDSAASLTLSPLVEMINKEITEINSIERQPNNIQDWLAGIDPVHGLQRDSAQSGSTGLPDITEALNKAANKRGELNAKIPKIKWKLIFTAILTLLVVAFLLVLALKFSAPLLIGPCVVVILLYCMYACWKVLQRRREKHVHQKTLDLLNLSFYLGTSDKLGIFKKLWNDARVTPTEKKVKVIEMYGYAQELKQRINIIL